MVSANASKDNTENESVEDATTDETEIETETTAGKETETETTIGKETETKTTNKTETETASESETVQETESSPISGTSRAGAPTEVSTWQEFIDALADITVDHILLTADLTRTSPAAADNPGTIGRTLTIDGGTAGHSISFGSGSSNATNGILLADVTEATYLTLTNITLTKTSGPAYAMFYSSTASTGVTNWNIALNNVKTNVDTGTSNAAGLINANASVTVYGTDNNLAFNSNTYHLFNVDSFTMSAGSSLTATARGTGYLFRVNQGDFTMESGAALTASSTVATASTTLYSFEVVKGSFTMKAGSELTATSDRASLFNVYGNFTMEEGTTSLTAVTTSTSQTDYQFNVGGSFVMGKGSNFTTTTASTSESNSYYQVSIAGDFTMGADTTLTARSVRKSLFTVGGGFTVGENAVLSAESTSASQSDYQFNVSGDFVMKTGSTFTTSTATTAHTDSYYQVAAGGNFTMENNTNLKAESVGKSLFGITGDFTVGESATVTTNSTSGANRQFSVKNFTAKANSSITTTSAGATYQFYITGDFTMESGGVEGTGSSLTADSSGASNSVIYMTGSGTIDLGSFTRTKITNNGTSINEDSDSRPAYSNGIYGEVGALNMQAHSLLDLYATNIGYRTMVTNSLTMVGGAVFNATGVNYSAIALTQNYEDNNTLPATVNIDGTGTQLNLECSASSSATVNRGAAMVVAGTSAEGQSCVFNVTNGAEINGHATSNTVIQVRSKGSTFTVKDGAKINLVQDGGTYSLGATLRFRISGSQKFVIDNAEVTIQKLGGATEAVRLYNGGNSINVINGGRFYVYNAGNGSPNNGTGDQGNQGIHYRNGSSSQPDSFYVEGYGSVVEIVADNGPAISSTAGSTTTVQAMSGSTFILEGKTSDAGHGGAIQSTSVTVFELDNPLYFDLRNNRSGGGRVLESSGGTSNMFTLNNSDFSVWTQGSNLEGDPTKSWSLIDFVLNGNEFDSILSTNFPSEFNTTYYAGSSAYSRMSANNASAVIDELRVPTNADRYIYGHAYVPEGLDDTRDAWTEEVYVTVKVTNEDGTSYYLEGTTIGVDEDGGLSVYGEPIRGGMFEILNDPDGDGTGEYLRTGQTVEVVSAYRSNSPISVVGESRVHKSTAQDLKASAVITWDVTPPTALTMADVDISASKMYVEASGTKFTTRTTVISGTSTEIGATVYLYIYREDDLSNLYLSSWATGTVEVDGKWSVSLPEALIEDDLVAIALNDNVSNTGQPDTNRLTSYDTTKLVDNGVFANGGNENPSGDCEFHDTTFTTRLEIGVMYYGVLELTVSPEIEYGTHGISSGVTTYPAGSMVLSVEDSRVERNQWELTAKMDEPFTLNGGTDVLDIDLIYSYNGTETAIGSSAVNIWRHTNTSDVFDVYDQWMIPGNGSGLFVKASAGKVKTGSYTAKVNWVLSDVP